jgi:6-phosphofructokinase 1
MSGVSPRRDRRRAIDALARHAVDALIVIGGDGSQAGAHALAHMGVPVVGIASTIDNDLSGSDITLGVDTALNIALEAIDRLKTTASSHQRAFLVEVMGRCSGYLALMAGIAGGAEVVVIPEAEMEPDEVAAELRRAYERGKAHAIAVVAEGARANAAALARHFAEHYDVLGFDLRVTTLGHVQRGGAPGAFDRLLGTRLGAAARKQPAIGRRRLRSRTRDHEDRRDLRHDQSLIIHLLTPGRTLSRRPARRSPSPGRT